ncbi:MAG: TIGR00730 family Rossman fold protein [Bacteroidales bacterium]|nr:TIGR00730 family Rossman fold protein [Bacteroidales bacterium]
MIRIVTIYCASSGKTPKKYKDIAFQLADILIDNNIGLLYGGGAVGLMGCIADRYVEKNGNIRGIIPEFMVKVEWAHPKVKDLVIVQNMHERKQRLIENTDAVIALPGGTGTLEELMEVLALKRLGKFIKPIVILNSFGFYDELLAFFNTMVSEKFLRPDHLDAYKVVNSPSKVIQAILDSPEWNEGAIENAPV